MLLEHALVLHKENIVPIKGVWIDPNKNVHEGRVLDIDCQEEGIYRLVIDGMWGNAPVSISQAAPTQVVHGTGEIEALSVQFGALLLKVDHFRDDPMEWLAEHGMDISTPQQKIDQHAGVR